MWVAMWVLGTEFGSSVLLTTKRWFPQTGASFSALLNSSFGVMKRQWWWMSVIPAAQRQEKEDGGLEASLSHTVRPSL